MTDIVDRLRKRDDYDRIVILDHLDRPLRYGLAKSLEHEAADEIERLRAALEMAADCLHDVGALHAWAAARAVLEDHK